VDSETVEAMLSLEFGATLTRDAESESDLSHIYSMAPRLKIARFGKDIKYAKDSGELQEGDVLIAIGGVENPTYVEMRRITKEHKGKKLPLKVLRESEEGGLDEIEVTVSPHSEKERVQIGIYPVLDMKDAVVSKTISIEGMEKLDIPAGARITAVDGAAVESFYDVIEEIRKYPNERITLDYRVSDEIAGSVTIETGDWREFVAVENAIRDNIPFKYLTKLYKASGPVDAIGMGSRKTMQFVLQTYLTLRSMIGGDVGAENLKGPIGIIGLSYSVITRFPLMDYLYILGLISACISVINFLPMLPFDGGHVVFLVIEKLKGSPVNERIQMSAATVGWVLVGALFLYLTYNDIANLVRGVFF
jgi:regulator of sigma E protease